MPSSPPPASGSVRCRSRSRACAGRERHPPAGRRFLKRAPFGATADGQPVECFTLTNPSGIELRFLTLGGIIQSLWTPDRHGAFADIALGHQALPGYEADTAYLGAIVGRYANRIAGGRFTLEGRVHELARNNGANHLHGGVRGFDRAVWQAEPFRGDGGEGAVLSHTSPDGDEGYPGTLRVRVTYTLTGRNELICDYAATTDRPTPVNLTQHSYFNLAGDARGDILGHRLLLPARTFLPVDAGLIPTGEIRSVEGTAFDFRRATPIGARIGEGDEQLTLGEGYDHTFVLDRPSGGGLVPAARLEEPVSGRVVEIETTEPGVQFYSGNHLGRGAGGRHARRSGVALETQHFPDSPNRPAFPSTILRPGAEFSSRTVYRFTVAA